MPSIAAYRQVIADAWERERNLTATPLGGHTPVSESSAYLSPLLDPVKALDDDGGWLRGDELQGLALWRHATRDRRSDDGEVRPASAWGIVGIATRRGLGRGGGNG